MENLRSKLRLCQGPQGPHAAGGAPGQLCSRFLSGSRAAVLRRQQQQTQCTAVRTKQVEGCWVTAPLGRRPQGVIHFLGGAFAGAAPQLVYSLLIQLLAEAGYLIISTPFYATFLHATCARQVHQDFQRCMAAVQAQEGWLVPTGAAVHGVGHSNGALLHLLIASLHNVPNASNVIISFNNKQVKQAIPIPLKPLQNIVRQSRSTQMLGPVPAPVDILQRTAAAAASAGVYLDPQLIESLTPAVAQIEAVLGEVGDGNIDFVPSPAESQSLIASRYAVPSTLLIRFANDMLDETSSILPLLQKRMPSGILNVVLPGSHVTPCGGNIDWQVGRSFSLLDAISLGAKLAVQSDIRRLADRIITWLSRASKLKS